MDDAASWRTLLGKVSEETGHRHARNFKVEWRRKPCAIVLHLESYVTWRWHAVWRVQDPVLQLAPFECSPWTLAPCISSILWAGGVPVPKFSLSLSSSSYTYGRLVWTLQNLTGMARKNIGTAGLAALSPWHVLVCDLESHTRNLLQSPTRTSRSLPDR